VRLVGFTIEIYHDGPPYGRQILTGVCFPHFIQAHVGVLRQSVLHPLPFTSFQIHDSLAILQFDIYSLCHRQKRTAYLMFCTAEQFAFRAAVAV
jgi:hypothetical protein